VSPRGSIGLLSALLLSALGACGYQVGGLYPEREVRIEAFDNLSERRTHEFELTGSVARELMARGFRVNAPGAPLVLRGKILDMRTPSVVDQVDTDKLLVGALTVRLEISLSGADGHERWRDERTERVTFTPSRAEGFETARREAFDRLSRWVVSHFEKEW
jgi:hypothetical protein